MASAVFAHPHHPPTTLLHLHLHPICIPPSGTDDEVPPPLCQSVRLRRTPYLALHIIVGAASPRSFRESLALSCRVILLLPIFTSKSRSSPFVWSLLPRTKTEILSSSDCIPSRFNPRRPTFQLTLVSKCPLHEETKPESNCRVASLNGSSCALAHTTGPSLEQTVAPQQLRQHGSPARG